MAARVFFSYAHEDETLRNQLEVRLAMLKRQGLIEIWHDRQMRAGDLFDWAIDEELNEADIILLLVSPDFLASDYCYNIEKARALKRHREGTARLISVILRPCEWEHTDLARYVVTPTDGRPVTRWPDIDDAFLDVTRAIRRAIEEIGAATQRNPAADEAQQTAQPVEADIRPRSSNLRLRKNFTQADKDRFLEAGFEFMDRFFQGSLEELAKRNTDIEGRYRRVDGNAFTAAIYRNGVKAAACSIRLNGGFGDGITYTDGDKAPTNTFNESVTVKNDDQKLFFDAMGMSHMGNPHERNALTHEGAAEYFWSILIEPLQGH